MARLDELMEECMPVLVAGDHGSRDRRTSYAIIKVIGNFRRNEFNLASLEPCLCTGIGST